MSISHISYAYPEVDIYIYIIYRTPGVRNGLDVNSRGGINYHNIVHGTEFVIILALDV